MAIKISNVSVIDNDRNVINANTTTFTGNTVLKLPAGGTASRPGSPENGMVRYNSDEGTFEGYAAGEWGPLGAGGNLIQTPTNISPANGETGVSVNPTLAATDFRHVYDLEKVSGTWQISNNISFSSTVLNQTITSAANSYVTTANLNFSTTYYWRVRYTDGDGNSSDFSTPTEFTTAFDPPTVLGQSFQGGYYTGTIDIGGGTCYYLVVAPNSSGCAFCQWKTTRTATSGTGSCVNGYTNTYPPLENATHPAGNWTSTRTIAGFSDWYLPARDELNVLYTNKESMPAGEGYASDIDVYWSSTEASATFACVQRFSDGYLYGTGKTATRRVRAVRRVAI